MADFLSNRVKKKYGLGISSTRYDFLSLDQAEPDLGNPLVGPSSIGAKPYPAGGAYILASFAQTDKSDRFWVPPSALSGLGLGVIPGAFTIRDEGVVVGTANSFTILNFVGDGVTIDSVGPNPEDQTGIATIRVTPVGYGIKKSIQYHGNSGFLEGANTFVFDPTNLNVGIGLTNPTSRLDVSGNVKISGITTSTILSSSSLTSTNLNVSGITTTNSLYIDNAEILSNSRQLKNISSLDSVTTATIESAIANAPNTFTDLNVSGISTLNTLTVTGVSTLSSLSIVGLTTANRFYAETVVVSAAATIGFITATNIHVSGTTTSININSTNSITTGIATIGFLTATNANVSGIITSNRLNVSTANVSVAATIQNITTPILNVSVASTIQTLNTTSLTNSGNVSIGSSLVVDTNTLIVDSVANSVGIGTTPGHKLHVEGDVKVSDLFYVSNGRGITGQVLLSQGSSPPVWGAPDAVTVGAAQSIYIDNDQSSNTNYYPLFTPTFDDTGYVHVDTNGLVYNPQSNNLGIGSTQPGFNVDVLGNINFTGGLYQNGEIYVASRWGINDITSDIYRVSGNVGIGTTLPTSKLTVKGDTLLVGITTINDDTTINGITNLQGGSTEKVISTFSTNFPSTLGKLSVNVENSTVVVGVLTESVNTWEFVGVNTDLGKATTVTLIVDSNSLLTYGENFSIAGVGQTGGVRWNGGIAPIPTDNDDILSFTIIRDSAGTFRVYGASSLNFS